MTFNLTDKTQVRKIWFISGPGGDWMAMVLKQEDEQWKLRYRFRYHASPEPFDDGDELRWYEVRAKEGAKDGVNNLVMAGQTIATVTSLNFGGAEIDEIEVNGDGERAFELIRERPWCHFQLADAPSPNTREAGA